MLQDTGISDEEALSRRRQLLHQQIREGIAHCRRGDWEMGVAHLSRVEQLGRGLAWQPGLPDSYLGYGIASQQGQYEQGLRLCQTAVQEESWEAENFLNLARTYLLRSKKKLAVAALDRGLEVDPAQPQLIALRRKLGVRRGPTVPFLPRGHSLNVLLGTLRHRARDAFHPPRRSLGT